MTTIDVRIRYLEDVEMLGKHSLPEHTVTMKRLRFILNASIKLACIKE